MVEFALVVPIFLLVVLAFFEIGRGVFAYNSITNAAREGARLAIVNQDANLIKQRAIAQTAVAETTTPNLTVAFKEPDASGNPSGTNCAATAPTLARAGCVAVVTYQTTFRPITPIISRVLWPNGITVTATSVETIEYACPNKTISVSADCPRQP